ncbi:MAG TPA: putative glycolipid-binding domain-containing protein [Acidimicrobiales bacterium]
MAVGDLPPSAAWRHHTARDGFEAVFFSERPDGWFVQGHTSAVESGRVWAVRFDLIVDSGWRTRTAHVWSQADGAFHELVVESDGDGHWHVDGVRVTTFDGCFDVDLESTVATNTLPLHRLSLSVGEQADAPALFVHVPELETMRLDQQYRRVDDEVGLVRFDYRAPTVDYAEILTFDASGLVVDYPRLATRVR